MPEPRQLTSAPITEAVIDLRVKSRPDPRIPDLEGVAERLSDDYPHRYELTRREFLFELGEDSERVESRRHAPFGFRLATPAKNRVLQVRPNGFTYSWLTPYSNWTELRTSAKRAWEVYEHRVRPGELWELLDRLRDLKNRIFFNSVTEQLLERFE